MYFCGKLARRAVTSIIFSLVNLPIAVHAETFYYHPSASISLGEPYDELDPGESLIGNGIFSWTESGYEQEDGVNAVNFSYQEISSFSALSKALSIDASAEASFTFSDFSTSIQYDRLLEKTSNEIVVAITAYRELKPKKKKGDIALTSKGKSLLDTATSGDQLHLWRQISGSDVIVETVSGHSVTMFYRFSSADKSKIETLRTSVSTEWSSGSATANLVTAAKAVDGTVSVSIDYEQAGGASNLSALNALLSANNGDVNAIREAMKLALESADSENARVLRFNTIKVANLSDVVFGTEGKFKALADFYASVRDARAAHFERLLTAQGRLIQSQRLLDEKPDQLFSQDGKAKLTQLRDELKSVTETIRAEYKKYDTLNPDSGNITTDAGQSIPMIASVQYFKAPYVKIAQWVRTEGQAARCGWSTYKDCEFHDFHVQFYPKLQFTLPEFVQRVRLLQVTGGSCIPLTTARKNSIKDIVSSGGNFADFFSATYSAHKVYTWGSNHMPGAFNNWKDAMSTVESQQRYILEVTSTDESVHYVDIGAYGKPVDPAQAVVPFETVCGA